MVLAHGGLDLYNNPFAEWGAVQYCQAVLVGVAHRVALTASPHPPKAGHGTDNLPTLKGMILTIHLPPGLHVVVRHRSSPLEELVTPSVSHSALGEPFCSLNWVMFTSSNPWGPLLILNNLTYLLYDSWIKKNVCFSSPKTKKPSYLFLNCYSREKGTTILTCSEWGEIGKPFIPTEIYIIYLSSMSVFTFISQPQVVTCCLKRSSHLAQW